MHRPHGDPETNLRRQIAETLALLYMGPSRFLKVFAETPDQAIVALKSKPESFGRLRTYLGPISVQAAKTRLLRLARKLRRISCSA